MGGWEGCGAAATVTLGTGFMGNDRVRVPLGALRAGWRQASDPLETALVLREPRVLETSPVGARREVHLG